MPGPVQTLPPLAVGARRVISTVKIFGVARYCHAQPVEVEIGITRLHRIPGPLDKTPAFLNRALTLTPLQTRPHTLVLILRRDGHHVRVAKDLSTGAHTRQMCEQTPPAAESHPAGQKRPASNHRPDAKLSSGGVARFRDQEVQRLHAAAECSCRGHQWWCIRGLRCLPSLGGFRNERPRIFTDGHRSNMAINLFSTVRISCPGFLIRGKSAFICGCFYPLGGPAGSSISVRSPPDLRFSSVTVPFITSSKRLPMIMPKFVKISLARARRLFRIENSLHIFYWLALIFNLHSEKRPIDQLGVEW